MLVDSHCHLNCLNLEKYQGDFDQVLQAAKQLGVEHFLCVCIDLENFPAVLAIANRYPQVMASVGLHPTSRVPHEPTKETLVNFAQNTKVVALGETGLDYYRITPDDIEWQQQRFKTHIEAAKTVDKPLIIHTRDAREDTLRIMQQHNADQIGGVMHCFTESWEMAQQAMAMNFYISISGIVTFKNAKELQEVVKKIPLDRLLIETDSPYLAPVPHRGKANEPAYVWYVAQAIAELKNVSFDVVAEQTTQNYFNCFRIHHD